MFPPDCRFRSRTMIARISPYLACVCLVVGAPAPIYLRFANNYAYVTSPSKTALDKDNLLDPSAILPPNDDNLLSASWDLAQIPDALKQIGLQQMELRFKDEEQKKQPGETKAQ